LQRSLNRPEPGTTSRCERALGWRVDILNAQGFGLSYELPDIAVEFPSGLFFEFCQLYLLGCPDPVARLLQEPLELKAVDRLRLVFHIGLGLRQKHARPSCLSNKLPNTLKDQVR